MGFGSIYQQSVGEKKEKLLHTEKYNWVIKCVYIFAPHWIKELLISLPKWCLHCQDSETP